MAYKTMPTNNYIKFVRGTKEQYQQLTVSNDTLYFIYDTNDPSIGELYLGNKLIGDGKGATSLSELISNTVADGDLLVYDEATESWISTSPDDAIRIMSGATSAQDGQSGLVPMPKQGDETKYLRGDGQWSEIPSTVMNIDDKTLELFDNKITLKDFNIAPVGSILQKTNSGVSWASVPSVPISGDYVETATFQTAVENLEELINSKTDNSDFNALSNRVNEINLRLTWQEIVED